MAKVASVNYPIVITFDATAGGANAPTQAEVEAFFAEKDYGETIMADAGAYFGAGGTLPAVDVVNAGLGTPQYAEIPGT